MKFEEIKFLNDEELLRLTGVKQKTFTKMIDILRKAELEKFKKGGKPNKLSLENRILMALTYWREYRTYFHIGKSFSISEANCYRNIKWIEDVLIKNPDFQKLSGQKALIKEHFSDKSIIIDVTETPIQRPKKVKNDIIQEKRKNIQ